MVPADPTALAFSLVVVLAVAEAVNWIFARTFAVPANRESSLITGLLVVLLMTPVTAADLPGVGGLVAAAAWAIASKYMIRLRGRHVFNPAAFGVALTGLVLVQPATWWVTASANLLPVIVAGGICIVIKVRRADMVLAGIAAYVTGAVLTAPPGTSLDTLLPSLAQTSILFLSFAMLTEPLTAWRGRRRMSTIRTVAATGAISPSLRPPAKPTCAWASSSTPSPAPSSARSRRCSPETRCLRPNLPAISSCPATSGASWRSSPEASASRHSAAWSSTCWSKGRRDAVLLYGCGRAAEFAYRDIFESAREQIGLKPVYAAQFEAEPPAGIQSGIIDEGLIRREMPDWKERLFYVSGPPPMVRAVRKTLRRLGVLPWRIRTDFFPGLSS